MRIRLVSCSALLSLAFTSPALLLAQFQAPNPEELKMTADPNAPGAAAEFLEINESSNDNMHVESHYERIKVLSEKGKELATVSLPYDKGDFKIDSIQGRTIHADGTIIPLTVKAEDLVIEQHGDEKFNKRVFTLPDAEVGSILEYKYAIRYDDNMYTTPEWEVQRKYPVRKAHYDFLPFKGFLPGMQNQTSMYLTGEDGVDDTLMSSGRVPDGTKVVQIPATGQFTLDVTNVPAIPDEAYMPPINAFLYHVKFYYKHASSNQEFWIDAGKRWTKNVDHFAEPTGAIKAAAAGLVAPSDSELDKAKKIYAAVQALDNTDYSREKTKTEKKELGIKEEKRAEDTWKQKSGNSEDIAMLYLALLRGVGLTAYPAKVVDRERGQFDVGYMTVRQLDDTVVLLVTGGKEVTLDPGEKMCPFGIVNWRHSGAAGLGESAQGLSITSIPKQIYTDNHVTRVGTLTLDEHGRVDGDINITMTGQEALSWRQTALRSDMDEVKKQFDSTLETMVPDGVEAHVDHFLGMDDSSTNLMAVVKVTGNMGTATAKRILLPGMFFESRGGTPFVNEEKRLEPVDMHYGDIVTDQITYKLPAGLGVEGAPPDTTFDWAGHARYATKSVSKEGQIVVARSLARAFTDAKPEEYQDLRGFYAKIASSDQAQIVLTATAAVAPKDSSVVDLK